MVRDGRQCHRQAALVNLSCCGSREKKKKNLRKAFTSERGDNALTREMQLGIEVEEGPIEQHGALAESQPATEESNTLDFVGPRGQDN